MVQTHPKPRPMTVRLLSNPSLPLETLWVIWEQSRHNNPVPTPEEVASLIRYQNTSDLSVTLTDTVGKYGHYFNEVVTWGKNYDEVIHPFQEKFWQTIRALFTEGVPCTENLQFVFLIENLPISLREQLVRHRIGTHLDPRLGADTSMYANVAESSEWSQTTRVLDLSSFYDDGFFFVPEGIPDKYVPGPQTPWGQRMINPAIVYHNAMLCAQELYKELLAAGVHVEDARQVIPLGMTHRMTWGFNLKSLMHIVGKRSCWIAQFGIWAELIEGIVAELAKLHPEFRNVVNPPCIKNNKWAGCPVNMINRERIDGRDGSMAPCPLWLHHNRNEAVSLQRQLRDDHYPDMMPKDGSAPKGFPKWFLARPGDESTKEFPLHGMSSKDVGVPFPGGWITKDQLAATMMEKGRGDFQRLWRRNVDTGEPLETANG